MNRRPRRELSLLPAAPPLTGLKVRKAKHAYLAALAKDGAQTSDALAAAGVTLSQVRGWRDNDPEFASLEQQAALFKDDKLRRTIDEMIGDRNEKIILGAMKRLPEYNPVKHTEVTVEGAVVHKHLAGKDESALDKIIMAGAELIEDAEYEVIETKRITTGEQDDTEAD